jgi:hypothetical protein
MELQSSNLELQSLNTILAVRREALRVLPVGPSFQRLMALTKVGGSLLNRFQVTFAADDMEEAIQFLRAANDIAERGQPGIIYTTKNLSDALWLRYWQLPDKPAAFRDEAIAASYGYLEVATPGSPAPEEVFYHLSILLSDRYEATHRPNPDDLKEAVTHARAAYAIVQGSSSIELACTACHLGRVLYMRYMSSHDMTDLDQAINVLRESVCMMTMNHHERTIPPSSLGICLRARYVALGVVQDHTDSIAAHKLALKMAGSDTVNMATLYTGLADAMAATFHAPSSSTTPAISTARHFEQVDNKDGSSTSRYLIERENRDPVTRDTSALLAPLQHTGLPRSPLPGTIVDLSGEISFTSKYPVGHGGFSEVWKGLWSAGNGQNHEVKMAFICYCSPFLICQTGRSQNSAFGHGSTTR